MKKCNTCGAQVGEQARFCSKCGSADLVETASMKQKITLGQISIYRWQLICGCAAFWVFLVVMIVVISSILKEDNDVANYQTEFSSDEFLEDTEEIFDADVVDEPVVEEEPENTTTTEVTPADIPYSMDEIIKAITAYNNYRNFGVCCEIDYDAIVYGEAWEYMTSEQQEVAADLLTCGCCGSIASATSHVGEYLAGSMNRGVDPFVLVEYRGILYCIVGQVQQVSFNSNDLQVVRTAYNKLSVTAGRYSSLDATLEGYTRIDFEYQNGTYKIIEATDLN